MKTPELYTGLALIIVTMLFAQGWQTSTDSGHWFIGGALVMSGLMLIHKAAKAGS